MQYMSDVEIDRRARSVIMLINVIFLFLSVIHLVSKISDEHSET